MLFHKYLVYRIRTRNEAILVNIEKDNIFLACEMLHALSFNEYVKKPTRQKKKPDLYNLQYVLDL